MRSANEGIRRPVRLALLIAAGLVLFVLDSLLPKPVPFMRYGIANIAILYIMVMFGFRGAWFAAVIKVLAGSLVTGTFPGIPFILSAVSTTAGLCVMTGAVAVGGLGLSLVGISVASAVTHMAVQLLLTGLLFMTPGDAVALFPVLIPAAIVSGAVIGIIVRRLIRQMPQDKTVPVKADGV